MCEWDGGDYTNTTIIFLSGRTRNIDKCLVPLIKALNYAGMVTVASCCGHGKRPGSVILADGRELLICPDQKTARKMDKMFPALSDKPETQGGSDEQQDP